jgi:hypothetical protein
MCVIVDCLEKGELVRKSGKRREKEKATDEFAERIDYVCSVEQV